jgi:hypothetical protein
MTTATKTVRKSVKRIKVGKVTVVVVVTKLKVKI